MSDGSFHRKAEIYAPEHPFIFSALYANPLGARSPVSSAESAAKAKQKLRDVIAADVAEFIAGGGKIEKCGSMLDFGRSEKTSRELYDIDFRKNKHKSKTHMVPVPGESTFSASEIADTDDGDE